MHAIDAYEDRRSPCWSRNGPRPRPTPRCREHLRGREITVIGLPGQRARILAELAGLPGVRTENAEDLPAAVRLARKLTPAGGVVLLSPAAPATAGSATSSTDPRSSPRPSATAPEGNGLKTSPTLLTGGGR
jgi:UDP-N-acetylmuramoylalanine--D-glutamate ligase